VLAHGGLEHSGRYAHVAHQFTNAGLATYAIDFRGHGRSGGRAGQIERLSLLVDDLDRLVRLVAQRHSGVQMFLLAHSLGAMVALEYVISVRRDSRPGAVRDRYRCLGHPQTSNDGGQDALGRTAQPRVDEARQ
jgi:acylglycerol lipase